MSEKSMKNNIKNRLMSVADKYIEAEPQFILHTAPMFDDMAETIIELMEKKEQETMHKFGLKKSVKYDVKASDKVIVITLLEDKNE